MPPIKKPTGKVANAPTVGKPVDASGIYVPCLFPPWDDADVEREDWGDLTLVLTPQTPLSALFVDGGIPEGATAAPQPSVPYLQNHVKEWKRPSAIFSPFKPVVVRNNNTAGTNSQAGSGPDSETTPATASTTNLGPHTIKKFKNEELDPHVVVPYIEDRSSSVTAALESKRRPRKDRGQAAMPPFMRAFNSALLVLQHHEGLMMKGTYAWELIYPQSNGMPVFNPTGKYAVKLFWNGAYFKIIIDDRLPTDIFGQSMFTVTDAKEIWPALLVKAMLKVLGPANEHLLFTNPVTTLSCLLSGWVPQLYSPIADDIRILDILETQSTQPNNIVVIGLNGDTHMSSYLITGREREGVDCTLITRTSNIIEELAPFVFGQCSVHPTWLDTKVSWGLMKKLFSRVVVFRPITATAHLPKSLYVDAKQVYHPPPEAGATDSTTHTASSTTTPSAPISTSKWAVIKAAADVDILFVHSALYVGNEGVPTGVFKATVQQFDWKHRPHFRTLTTIECPQGSPASVPLRLPKGVHTLKIDIDGMVQHREAFTMLSSTESVTWGDEKDMYTALGLTRWSDAGTYGTHEANSLTMWFKRHIVIKGPQAECYFHVHTVPRGTDVEHYKIPLAVADPKGKAGPADKGKPGGKPAPAAAVVNPVEEVVIPDPIISITTHTELLLVDLDNGHVVRSNDGNLLTTIPSNKTGYMLLGYARPPVAYPKGLWVCSLTAEGNFERIETKPFEDAVTRTGEYKVNAHATVFKYFITAGEAATASILVNVVEDMNATYTVVITQNDKPIATRTDVRGKTLIEHITFIPPEKGANTVYAIVCTLDTLSAQVLRHSRSEKAKGLFHQSLMNASTSQPQQPNTAALLAATDVKYTLKILGSSPKIEIKDDTAPAEALAAIKANWAKPKDTPQDQPAAKAQKPTGKDKGAISADDGARAVKAKEARQKYLLSLNGEHSPPPATPGTSTTTTTTAATTTTTTTTQVPFPECLLIKPHHKATLSSLTELQAKSDAYAENLLSEYKSFLQKGKTITEENLVFIQKQMEASVVGWAARRKEAAGTEIDDPKGKGGAAAKKK
eukprot:PhF_6_TR43012/c1_g1_i3/m.65731